MALLAGNDKLKQDQTQQQGGQQQASEVGSGALVGGASNIVSGGSGGQASAPGAQGAWTNIQAYLKANEGNTGSANYFDNKVNQTFDKEKETAQKQADDIKNQAKDTLEKTSIGQDKASQILNQASQNYSYSGKQADPYQQQTGQLKTALTSEFSGPREFNYGLSNEAQRFGQVGDQGAFKNIMEGLYNEAAGGQMNRGQLALQRQLDVSNQNLNQARDNAVNKFGTLNQDINSLAQNTTQDLQGIEGQFRGNQEALKNFLSNQANTELQNKAKAEADARAAFDKAYGAKSGQATASYDEYLKMLNSTMNNPQNLVDTWSGQGAWGGDNATWKNLSKEMDVVNSLNDFQKDYHLKSDDLKSNQDALKNFYSQQDSKYANTADSNKRTYNTIMDILNEQNRLDKGFKVRG